MSMDGENYDDGLDGGDFFKLSSPEKKLQISSTQGIDNGDRTRDMTLVNTKRRAYCDVKVVNPDVLRIDYDGEELITMVIPDQEWNALEVEWEVFDTRFAPHEIVFPEDKMDFQSGKIQFEITDVSYRFHDEDMVKNLKVGDRVEGKYEEKWQPATIVREEMIDDNKSFFLRWDDKTITTDHVRQDKDNIRGTVPIDRDSIELHFALVNEKFVRGSPQGIPLVPPPEDTQVQPVSVSQPDPQPEEKKEDEDIHLLELNSILQGMRKFWTVNHSNDTDDDKYIYILFTNILNNWQDMQRGPNPQAKMFMLQILTELSVLEKYLKAQVMGMQRRGSITANDGYTANGFVPAVEKFSVFRQILEEISNQELQLLDNKKIKRKSDMFQYLSRDHKYNEDRCIFRNLGGLKDPEQKIQELKGIFDEKKTKGLRAAFQEQKNLEFKRQNMIDIILLNR